MRYARIPKFNWIVSSARNASAKPVQRAKNIEGTTGTIRMAAQSTRFISTSTKSPTRVVATPRLDYRIRNPANFTSLSQSSPLHLVNNLSISPLTCKLFQRLHYTIVRRASQLSNMAPVKEYSLLCLENPLLGMGSVTPPFC